MLKSDITFLRHIIKECDYLLTYSDTLDANDFYEDETLKRAFTRCLEIIGEATKRINADFRLAYKEVPWKEMAGMRDVIIHYYEGVDYSVVWFTVKNKIPELHFQISEIIKKHNNKL